MGKRKIENEEKRKREPNYTKAETRRLLKIIATRAHIIENKRTDSVTWKQKEETWKEIAAEYNAITGNVIRTPERIRQKYEATKRDIKRKVAFNKKETYKTGGGSSPEIWRRRMSFPMRRRNPWSKIESSHFIS